MTVTTSWQLAAGHARIDTNLFFGSTTALTDGTGDNIPASNVFSSLDAGPYTACNGPKLTDIPNDTASATCLGYGSVSPAATGSATHSFTLQLQGLPTTLPAGLYTGSIFIQAGAN